MQRTLFGLDIGGTSTLGIRAETQSGSARDPGDPGTWEVLGTAKGGSANPQNVPLETAREEIRRTLAQLGIDEAVDPEQVSVIAGSGGVDTPADERRLREMIAAAAPGIGPGQVTVVHDSRLILAAGGLDTGISVIAGTGSVAWGRTADGTEARAGGWGHLLGDEGSSWWVAREAVRRALHRADSGVPADDLDRAVVRARQLEDRTALISDFHPDPDRTEWAELATVVDRCAESGDVDARALLGRAAAELVDLAGAVAERLAVTGPVVIGGGLAGHSRCVQNAFVSLAADRGLTDIRLLDVEPVMGALHLAGSR